jgi:glucan phosphorylase
MVSVAAFKTGGVPRLAADFCRGAARAGLSLG